MQEQHSFNSPSHSPPTPDINHHSEQRSQVQDQNQARSEGRWDQNQHLLFLKGLFEHGKNWKEIQALVSTRMCSQVRSHAQKYFIKLGKIVKDRKKQKNKTGGCLTQIELQIMNNFCADDITKNTPDILIALINDSGALTRNNVIAKEKKHIQKCTVNQNLNQINFHKNKQPQTNKINEVHEGFKEDNRVLHQSCLDSFYENQYEDKSFFRKLMENNVELLQKGRQFTDLIDFEGHNHEEGHKNQDLQSAETRVRKSSFTLVDDLQNNQRLQEALHKIKTGIWSEK